MKLFILCLMIISYIVLIECGKPTPTFLKPVLPANKINRQLTRKELKKLTPTLDKRPTGKIMPHPNAGNAPAPINPAIVGGSSARAAQFPWQAVVFQDDSWMCGGSSISEDFIMTAAHCCLNIRKFDIYMGVVDYRDTMNRINLTSTTAIVHEGYDPNTLNNDICLIRLAVSIPAKHILSKKVVLIRLPSVTQAKKETFAGKSVIASGFGLMNDSQNSGSPTLNFVQLKVISNAQCARHYGFGTIKSNVICTSGASRRSICSGDSGGPLQFTDIDARVTQVGIVSFSDARSCYNPAGFARVSSHLGWISQHTNIAIRP